MKGFTLIETLIYMAISTLIMTSLLSIAFTLTTTQSSLAEQTQNELVGLYWLRAFDTAVHVHAIPNIMASLNEQPFIKNISVATSSPTGTSTLTFSINEQSFSLTVYEK